MKGTGTCAECGDHGYVNKPGYCAKCWKSIPPVERNRLWRVVDAAYFREYRKRPGVREKKRASDRAYQKARYRRQKA